jgi:hypothetical protein
MTPAEEVQKFLEEKKYSLSAKPEFVLRDDGTYSIIIKQVDVNKIPDEQQQKAEEVNDKELDKLAQPEDKPAK